MPERSCVDCGGGLDADGDSTTSRAASRSSTAAAVAATDRRR